MDPFPWKSVSQPLIHMHIHTWVLSGTQLLRGWGEPCSLNFLHHFLGSESLQLKLTKWRAVSCPCPHLSAALVSPSAPYAALDKTSLWFSFRIRSHKEAVCLWEQNLRGAQQVCWAACLSYSFEDFYPPSLFFLHLRHGKGGIWVTEVFENRLGGQALKAKESICG